MAPLIADIIWITLGAAVGLTIGWWIGSASSKEVLVVKDTKPRKPAPPRPQPATPKPAAPATDDPAAPKPEDVEVMIARLQQLTESVAADVGHHNRNVDEINAELVSTDPRELNVLGIVERLVETNDTMQQQLSTAEEKLQEQAREIETHVRDARTDALTKLFNRRAFDDELARCQQEAVDHQHPYCVMMVDVDHFKQFNDTYGHPAGDAVLRGVARVLRNNVPNDAFVCRYGGEEFAVIFPNANLDAARETTERARDAIAQTHFHFEGLDLQVTASGGLAEQRTSESADQVVQRADQALYASKKAGRNCGHWHDGQTSHLLNKPAPELQPGDDENQQTPKPHAHNLIEEKHFREDVDRRIAEWKRGGSPCSVVLVRVDKIEDIEDDFGHPGSEKVNQATAQFLKAMMRDMDHIARMDDHCYALLLPGAKASDAITVADRLRAAVQRCRLPISGEIVDFTVSLAAAEVTMGDDQTTLLDRARSSLLTAQNTGGNRTIAVDGDGQYLPMQVAT